jgi:hypothetical protein
MTCTNLVILLTLKPHQQLNSQYQKKQKTPDPLGKHVRVLHIYTFSCKTINFVIIVSSNQTSNAILFPISGFGDLK